MNYGKMPLIKENREFQDYYTLHLKPLEKRVETLRQGAVKRANRRYIAALVAWLAAVGVIIFLGSMDEINLAIIISFALFAAVFLYAWAQAPTEIHIDLLNEQILPRIVSFFGDLHYHLKPNLEPREYDDWKVLPFFSFARLKDQIEGSYKGVPFKLAGIGLGYIKSGGHMRDPTEVITFSGFMMVFELVKEYSGVTLIRNQGSTLHDHFHLDETLNEVFADSDFEVFATSDAPGIKLADELFLQQLAEVSARFKARNLFCSFHANRLVMLVDGASGPYFSGYFRVTYSQETDFSRDTEQIRDQLGQFFAIVDHLQLEGVSAEERKEIQPLKSKTFPEPPELHVTPSPEIDNWGGLIVFVMFIASMAAYQWLLNSELYGIGLIWWSVCGGLLMSLGLFHTIRAVLRRSLWGAIFGIAFLGGALMVLYYRGSPNIQELIRSWLQIL